MGLATVADGGSASSTMRTAARFVHAGWVEHAPKGFRWTRNKALKVVDALRARGVDAHLAHEGVFQIGIRVVLGDGREALWDTDDTAPLEAQVMRDGMLVGFVPQIPGSGDYDVDQVAAAIADTDYDQRWPPAAALPPLRPHHCPRKARRSAGTSAASANADDSAVDGRAVVISAGTPRSRCARPRGPVHRGRRCSCGIELAPALPVGHRRSAAAPRPARTAPTPGT